MGGPQYQRDGQPAEQCGRRTGQPTLCGSLAFGMQGLYHLSRRFAFGRDDFREEREKTTGTSLQKSRSDGKTSAGIGMRRGTLPEQQRKMGGFRRTVERLSLRNLHGYSGRRRGNRPSEKCHERTYHQEYGRRRQQTLRLPVRKQEGIQDHRGRAFREVQQGILELRQTDFRCAALPHAARTRHQACRLATVGKRKYQHLEKRCGTCPEEIHHGRHGSQRHEMPELRSRIVGISRRMPHL